MTQLLDGASLPPFEHVSGDGDGPAYYGFKRKQDDGWTTIMMVTLLEIRHAPSLQKEFDGWLMVIDV